MDPDAVLDWILRLRERLDAAIADGTPIDPDHVYTLVGLLDELDTWLHAGHRAPRRWAAARIPSGPLVFAGVATPHNDAATPRRRAPVRVDRLPTTTCQLMLPFPPRSG